MPERAAKLARERERERERGPRSALCTWPLCAPSRKLESHTHKHTWAPASHSLTSYLGKSKHTLHRIYTAALGGRVRLDKREQEEARRGYRFEPPIVHYLLKSAHTPGHNRFCLRFGLSFSSSKMDEYQATIFVPQESFFLNKWYIIYILMTFN